MVWTDRARGSNSPRGGRAPISPRRRSKAVSATSTGIRPAPETATDARTGRPYRVPRTRSGAKRSWIRGRPLCGLGDRVRPIYQLQKRGAALTPLRKIARGSDRIDWRGSVLPHAVGIVESYDTGVTLRKLFYRLVAGGRLPNLKQKYSDLSAYTAQAHRDGKFPSRSTRRATSFVPRRSTARRMPSR